MGKDGYPMQEEARAAAAEALKKRYTDGQAQAAILIAHNQENELEIAAEDLAANTDKLSGENEAKKEGMASVVESNLNRFKQELTDLEAACRSLEERIERLQRIQELLEKKKP